MHMMTSQVHRKHKLQDIYKLENIPDSLNQDCKVKLSNLSSLSLRKSELDIGASEPVTLDERPLTPINESIRSPPKTFESLSAQIRKRIYPRTNWDFISEDDQQSLAAIILGEAGVVWAAMRKQVPDPFLTDWQNRELQRRIMVHIVTVCEQLFLYYCGHLKVLNARGVFSEAANVSRIRGQIAVDAGKYMNILAIRRHIVSDIKKSFKHKQQVTKSDSETHGPTTLPSSLSFRALMRKSRPKVDKEHQFNIGIEIKDMKNQMPKIDFRATYSSLQRKLPLKRNLSIEELAGSDIQVEDREVVKAVPQRLRKWNSEPMLTLDWEHEGKADVASPTTPHPRSRMESRAHIKTPLPPKSRAASAPKIRTQAMRRSNLRESPLDPREDLEQMMRRQVKTESSDLDADVPALIQAITRREKDDERMKMLKKEKEEFVRMKFDHEVAPPEPKHPQPPVVKFQLPGHSNPVNGTPTTVRTSTEQIVDKVELPAITLSTYGPLYNDLTGEISPNIVKDLDSNLFHGQELQEVYDEIMKTVPNDHLQFDNDDVVVTPIKEVDISKIRMAHSNNQNQHLPINPMLKMATTQPCPPGEENWKYNPPTESIASHGTNHKESRAYASWLAWWKATINTDDYLKYLSTQDSDFLGVIFHFYNSEDSTSLDGISSDSERLKAQREYNKRLEKIQASKQHYVRGMWNVTSVTLGGLGKVPDLDEIEDAEIVQETDTEDTIEHRSTIQSSPVSGRTQPGTTMTSQDQQSATPQRRFELVWRKLQLTREERVDIAMKYGGDGFHGRLLESVIAWEKVCGAILKREKVLHELEIFERFASDPKRLLQKGSSVKRLREATKRSKLYKKLTKLDELILPQLANIEAQFKDVVSFKGRSYAEKMEWDKVEMLYWLQQERRSQMLEEHGLPAQLEAFAAENYFKQRLSSPYLPHQAK